MSQTCYMRDQYILVRLLTSLRVFKTCLLNPKTYEFDWPWRLFTCFMVSFELMSVGIR